MQAFLHESLMGRIYAKHATSYSWEDLCKNDLHNLLINCMHAVYHGEVLEVDPVINHVLHKTFHVYTYL